MYRLVVPVAVAIAMSVGVPAHAISLKEAVRLTVETNPSGRADAANLRAVASELKESQTVFAPTVDVFGDVGVQRRVSPSISSSTGTKTLLTREVGVEASLLLLDGSERANTIYRNAARLDGATFRLLSTSETLALAAVEAYIDVVRHRNLFGATQRNIQRHQEIYRQIKERVSGGTSPASDRTQIEERLFAAEAVSVEVKKAMRDAEIKFKRVVGRMPGNTKPVGPVKGLPRHLSALIAESVASNYTIKQADLNIRDNEFSRDVARSALKPRVSLDGRASTGFDRSGSEGKDSDLYVGLTLSWRLFDGGLKNARERTTAERISEAEYRRDVAERDVRDLAERAWNAYKSGVERDAVLRRQLASNQKIVSSYREEYTLSKRSLLDVLDAERARFNNEFQQISIAATARFSAFRMLAVMSRLNRYFGISPRQLAPSPNAVETFTNTAPHKLFNVTIEPLQ